MVNFKSNDPQALFQSDEPFHSTPMITSQYTLGSAAYLRRLPRTPYDLHRAQGEEDHFFDISDRLFVPYRGDPEARYPTYRRWDSTRNSSYDKSPDQDADTFLTPLYTETVSDRSPRRAPSLSFSPTHVRSLERRVHDPAVSQEILNRADITARVKRGEALGQAYDPKNNKEIPEGNRVIPQRILSGELPKTMTSDPVGLETRTTVMIKDVPVCPSDQIHTMADVRISCPGMS